MPVINKTSVAIVTASVACSAVVACASSASLGDQAINYASFGRIQSTPFTDIIDGRTCRDALKRSLGFTTQTRTMRNGVYFLQDFRCRGDEVHVRASLQNTTADPMLCYAQTESAAQGTWIGPNGMAFFEYAFTSSADYNCELAS